MINVENTAQRQGDNLEAIDPETVRLVLRAITRVVDERSFEEVRDEMRAGDGAGLLAADAMSQAVKCLGAWSVIDRVQETLLGFAPAELMTPGVEWARESIARIRAGEVGFEHPDLFQAEAVRDAYLGELMKQCNSRRGTWLETAMLYLGELAVWAAWVGRADAYQVDAALERVADDAGLEICAALARSCGNAAAWEFVRSVRSYPQRFAA